MEKRTYTDEEREANLTGAYDEWEPPEALPGRPVIRIPRVKNPDIPLPQRVTDEILKVFKGDVEAYKDLLPKEGAPE